MKQIAKEHKADFQYARDLTRYYSKSFYFSTLLLPREKRWATFALYGFCRYVDNLIDVPRAREAGELLREVDALENEIRIAYRTGESLHPVIRPFILVAKEFGIPMEYPLDLLNGVRMDKEYTRYDNFDELYLFCYRVAGVVGLMMAPILGFKNPGALLFAEKLGMALQLTNILRDVKEDKNMGRIYLPLEELRSYGCSEDDILAEQMTPCFRNFMKFQVERARSYYHEGEKGIPMLDKASRFAILSAAKIYGGILSKIEMRDFNPFLGRVFVSQKKKFGIVLNELIRARVLAFASLFIQI